MRTSKIAQDTSRVVSALAARRQSLRSRASLGDAHHEESEPTESRKRKRGSNRTTVQNGDDSVDASMKQDPSPEIAKSSRARKARRQPAKKVLGEDGIVKMEPPANWEEMYKATQEIRARIKAPVDTMGCESLADESRSPRDQRFQTLTALMLSSQTKDTVTAVAIKNLQDNLPGVCFR